MVEMLSFMWYVFQIQPLPCSLLTNRIWPKPTSDLIPLRPAPSSLALILLAFQLTRLLPPGTFFLQMCSGLTHRLRLTLTALSKTAASFSHFILLCGSPHTVLHIASTIVCLLFLSLLWGRGLSQLHSPLCLQLLAHSRCSLNTVSVECLKTANVSLTMHQKTTVGSPGALNRPLTANTSRFFPGQWDPFRRLKHWDRKSGILCVRSWELLEEVITKCETTGTQQD